MKKFLHTFFAPLTSRPQEGALFGMDARIALIIASVLVGTGGITMMSRLERGKVLQTELSLEELRKGLETYYTTVGITELPFTLSDLFTEGIVQNPNLQQDLWNRNWYYSTTSEDVTLEGTPITVHFAVIHSAGKDGINNSNDLQTAQDYAGWEPLGDDIGIKFSTRDIEMERLQEYRARGQLITDKLTSYEASAYLQASGTCEGTTPAAFCENIESKNYTQLNYYPQSSLDEMEDVVYFSSISGETPTLTAGDINDMKSLMDMIGLPQSYMTDPWGRTLFYHSNITQSINPPFTASICFSEAGSCF